ncbi:T3SS effector HopA1 family protein [Streptomyces sp. NPDC059957]|uniref:T3SS effector HopA1 family protein n=1 Tax=Streptomyces sp. NPDC059957 TaxID=3347016 RepID=UPI0036466E35
MSGVNEALEAPEVVVGLSAALRSAVGGISVAEDGMSATVDGQELSADDPRALESLLAGALYETWHAGRREGAENLPRQLRDAEFEQALGGAVPHGHTSVGVLVHAAPERSAAGVTEAVVQRDGVRIRIAIARESVEGVAGETADATFGTAVDWVPGDRIALRVPAARPALSPGFFLVDGSTPGSGSGGATVRLYVHLTDSRSAVSVWGRVLSHLEERKVPYRAKVLSSRLLYPRRDALVVYLDEDARAAVTGLAEAIAGSPGVGEETSVFTHRLGPGVALAWEPEDRRQPMQGLSFGQHRASAVAKAVLDSRKSGNSVERELLSQFAEADIDPADPARNSTSPRLF